MIQFQFQRQYGGVFQSGDIPSTRDWIPFYINASQVLKNQFFFFLTNRFHLVTVFKQRKLLLNTASEIVKQ